MAAAPIKKKMPLSYQERGYRRIVNSGLLSSLVKLAETDLHILAPVAVDDRALQEVAAVRLVLERYIAGCPGFLDSLVPIPVDTSAPAIIQQMQAAGLAAVVGPMAAVAGVVAETVGKTLLGDGLEEVIVENGGDLFVARSQVCTVAVYAGQSPVSGKLGICLQPEQMPCGVCCSSGTIGHSLSLGIADAVVVVAEDTALADAAATRLGNEVGKKGKKGINRALAVARDIKGIQGVLVVSGEELGAWGQIELTGL